MRAPHKYRAPANVNRCPRTHNRMAKPRPHPPLPQERKSHSTARRRSCAPLPTAQAVRLSAHRRLHCVPVQFCGVRLISPAREGRAARSRLTARRAAGAALAGRGRATCQGRATQASGTLLSCISAAPRPLLGRTSAASRPHLGRISAKRATPPRPPTRLRLAAASSSGRGTCSRAQT